MPILSVSDSGFFAFLENASQAFQRFAETRSHTQCEKGFGNSQQASANLKTLTGLPCLPSSEERVLTLLDGCRRQDPEIDDLKH